MHISSRVFSNTDVSDGRLIFDSRSEAVCTVDDTSFSACEAKVIRFTIFRRSRSVRASTGFGDTIVDIFVLTFLGVIMKSIAEITVSNKTDAISFLLLLTAIVRIHDTKTDKAHAGFDFEPIALPKIPQRANRMECSYAPFEIQSVIINTNALVIDESSLSENAVYNMISKATVRAILNGKIVTSTHSKTTLISIYILICSRSDKALSVLFVR